ncbi:efflux RND transporter periplasmic adaptor subunit [bacterium]|nr:efflux RND transporter periplasmic adaptor subunit [bacterium]
MKTTRKITILAAVVIIAGLTTNKLLKDAHGDNTESAYSSVIPVGGYILSNRPFIETIEESGTLSGRHEAILSAEAGGQVEQILVEVGDSVRRGEPLLRLDDAILELESERALIAFEKAGLDFKRIEKLFEENSISQSDFEAARLALKSAEVQYKFARKSFDDATIRAPFSGVITSKLTEVGQMIDRGQPAFQIVDMEQLKLQVSVSEWTVSKLSLGSPATVFVEALGDTFPAFVSSIGSKAVQGARTFPVELRLEPAHGLKSGMFARASIFAGVDSSSIIVPRAATLPDVGRTVVFRARNGKADKVVVKVRGMSGDDVSIEGLSEGDSIIVTGNQLLSQGSDISFTLQ